MDLVIKFTEKSTNPNNYGNIHANLRVPFTQYSTLVIDSLTTNACFEVLNKDDYITFIETTINDDEEETLNEFTLSITESYSDLNSSSISTLLNDLLNIAGSNIKTIVDNTNRIVFVNELSFKIVSCSYRLKEVIGIYDQPLPIIAVESSGETNYILQCLSVGNYLSTAILYLIGSIGEKCFFNNEDKTTNRKILMRINNSYSANFPIIANNADFSVYALSNDFSDITFELVDARFNPIKLMSPMFLCGSLTGDLNAETINTSITITPEMINKNNPENT